MCENEGLIVVHDNKSPRRSFGNELKCECHYVLLTTWLRHTKSLFREPRQQNVIKVSFVMDWSSWLFILFDLFQLCLDFQTLYLGYIYLSFKLLMQNVSFYSTSIWMVTLILFSIHLIHLILFKVSSYNQNREGFSEMDFISVGNIGGDMDHCFF